MVQRSKSSSYSTRLLALSGAVALAVAGCQSGRQPAQGPSPSNASVLAQQHPTTEPVIAPSIDPAKTLEARAREYADSVAEAYSKPQPASPLMAPPLIHQKLPTTQPQNVIAAPQSPSNVSATLTKPEPSAVDWLPPGSHPQAPGGLLGSMLLAPQHAAANHTAAPVNPQVVPLVKPVIDTNIGTANEAVALADQNHLLNPNDLVSPPPVIVAPSIVKVPAVGDVLPALGGSGTDALENQVGQRLRDNPGQTWAQLDFQLLSFLQEQSVPRMDVLNTLPAEDREVVSAVIDGLSNFRNAVRADNNMLPSKKVRPLLELADRLRAQADLSIPTISLCTRVDGFGVYEPIDPPRFVAGAEHTALVYCEVENFASQIDEKKMWQTRLSQEAVLYTETGMAVWQDKSKVMTDLSRNRRHDFYIVKKVHLPANLTIGRYLMKVTIVDQEANRVSEATIPLSIIAQQP